MGSRAFCRVQVAFSATVHARTDQEASSDWLALGWPEGTALRTAGGFLRPRSPRQMPNLPMCRNRRYRTGRISRLAHSSPSWPLPVGPSSSSCARRSRSPGTSGNASTPRHAGIPKASRTTCKACSRLCRASMSHGWERPRAAADQVVAGCHPHRLPRARHPLIMHLQALSPETRQTSAQP